MASTARLLQQIRLGIGGIGFGRLCFVLYHHCQQQQLHSTTLLPKDPTTTFPHLLSSSRGTSWWTDFLQTRNPNKQPGYAQPKRATANLSFERDFFVRFTHPDCGTQMEKWVCKKCYESGTVVARCSGCNDYVVIANHYHQMYEDSRVLDFFYSFYGEHIGVGSDELLNFVLEKNANNNNGYARLRGPFNVLAVWETRNAAAVFRHDCGEIMTRMVYNKAMVEGLVVTRCSGCKQIVVMADHYGLFELLSNAKLGVNWVQTNTERGLVINYVDIENELEEGSAETINFISNGLEEGSNKTINVTVGDSDSIQGTEIHQSPAQKEF